MKEVVIYTDGACSGNPGPGGWGAVLSFNGVEKEISGGEAMTTNNRMELTAVITALSMLKEPCKVELYSDSTYVVNSVTLGWLRSWESNNFKKKGKDVPNKELWLKLMPLLARHQVTFHWVKGHAENEYNNRCDKLAVEAASAFKSQSSSS